MKIFKTIVRYISSRYTKVQLVVLAAIIVYAFILSDSNLFARFSSDAKIMELNSQIKYYREKTVQDGKQLELLHSSKDDIEKFARESYLMKKPNEDVYVVE